MPKDHFSHLLELLANRVTIYSRLLYHAARSMESVHTYAIIRNLFPDVIPGDVATRVNSRVRADGTSL